MQIETAFQENQLQLLKINDNFMKIQGILGDHLDLEPIDIESMFEYTSSILEDIQNRLMIDKGLRKKKFLSNDSIEKPQNNNTKNASKNGYEDNTELYKPSSPDKDDSHYKDQTNSEVRSNK